LDKLFTPVCLCHQAVWLGTSQGRWCSAAWKVTAGLSESNGSLIDYSHLWADCLYTWISSGPNARLVTSVGSLYLFYFSM